MVHTIFVLRLERSAQHSPGGGEQGFSHMLSVGSMIMLRLTRVARSVTVSPA
jgi:hypothetical protein